ncbi:MAG: DUF5701 family protein [Humibacillus sp.]|nr:DUF5701 family protein [Humibacillus sp.]MDN5777506.1 DUF5701 family protein [Humibacillus sp.]
MALAEQTENLIDLGVHALADITADDFRAHAQMLSDAPGAMLAVHPALVPPSRLASLLTRHDKPGFVVVDMTDIDQFEPITGIEIPEEPLYLIHDVNRGDEMRNWSPDEALPSITSLGRSPLTISEGISWLLQEPKLLEPNHCFMTIASRLSRGSRLDTRTPAIWISGGTGRDGTRNKHAPKVGWCWAGNRHTWLGFATTSQRGT